MGSVCHQPTLSHLMECTIPTPSPPNIPGSVQFQQEWAMGEFSSLALLM